MALKLRPTGLGAGIDKDRPDFTIQSGEWGVSTSSVAGQRHHVIGRASVPQIIGLLVCSPLRALSGYAPATATGLPNRIRAEATRRNWFSDRQMRLLGTLAFR